MKIDFKKKQTLSIAGVLVAGVLLAGLILGTDKSQPENDEHGHGSHTEAATHADKEHHGEPAKDGHADDKGHADEEHHEASAPRKGPHGGKLFTQEGYGVEVTIFEQGVEPEFRVYAYQDGKALDPAASQVSLTLERWGARRRLSPS